MTNLVAPQPQLPQPAGTTQPLQSTAPTIPTGVARAKVYARDPRKARAAIERGYDRWWDQMAQKQKLMEKAMNWRKNPNRMLRLAALLQKPDESWDEQKQKYPNDWKEDTDDLAELRAAAAGGEFNDQLATPS